MSGFKSLSSSAVPFAVPIGWMGLLPAAGIPCMEGRRGRKIGRLQRARSASTSRPAPAATFFEGALDPTYWF